MDLSKIISIGFELYVKDTFKNKDIQRFFLKHERRELFQKNLQKELYHSFHVIKNADTFKEVIKDCSALFCKISLKAKEKELNGSNITKPPMGSVIV